MYIMVFNLDNFKSVCKYFIDEVYCIKREKQNKA